MKKIIPLYLSLLLSVTFCKDENKKSEEKIRSSQEISQSENTAGTTSKEIHDIDLSEYNWLVPIELKDSKNKDVFKKYGIEFSGNCYACDLAVLKIRTKNFDLVNICDQNDFERFKGFKYQKTGNILKIETSETVFILTKVENELIYQLSTEGREPEVQNKRISEFYTTEKLINRFEEHDCGDFEG